MEIRIRMETEEVMNIIKSHILTKIPLDYTKHDVDVSHEYSGVFVVRVDPKKELEEEEIEKLESIIPHIKEEKNDL